MRNAARDIDAGCRSPLADRRFAYAKALAADGLWPEAADLFAQAIELAPDWVAAWIARGDALAACGDTSGALDALRQAATLDPDDGQGAALRLAALDPETMRRTGTASPTYVEALFDDYAARFETHLTRDLAYRGPALLRAALGRSNDRRFALALDLGCGTGLAGAAIRPIVDRLEGIDLSAEMVARARSKALYDRLVVGDILTFLQAEARAGADLVVAADVFVYIGDLAPILFEAGRVLRRDGAIAFTTQRWAGAGTYTVGADLRFAHADSYVAHTLAQAGFAVDRMTAESARRENGCDTPGSVVVGRRL